jgi:hypothetical protein
MSFVLGGKEAKESDWVQGARGWTDLTSAEEKQKE